MAHMEVYIDQLEQYSRRTSVRINGVKESELGEDVTTVYRRSCQYQPRHALTMADVNRAHRKRNTK